MTHFSDGRRSMAGQVFSRSIASVIPHVAISANPAMLIPPHYRADFQQWQGLAEIGKGQKKADIYNIYEGGYGLKGVVEPSRPFKLVIGHV